MICILILLIVLFVVYFKYYFNESFSNKILNISPVRIAVLIISNNPNNYIELNTNLRWSIEKKVWEKYMHTFINIDCFFIEGKVQIENFKTIQTDVEENIVPGIYQKTLVALKELDQKYDFYVRTNLSSFVNFYTLSRIVLIFRDFYKFVCKISSLIFKI